MSAMDIYWITRLDSLNLMFWLITILSFLVALLLACVAAGFSVSSFESYSWVTDAMRAERLHNAKIFKRWAILVTIFSVIVGWTSCFIPTTKQAAAIYLLPKIANNEQVKQMPDKAAQLLNGKLDEWLDDLRDKKINKP